MTKPYDITKPPFVFEKHSSNKEFIDSTFYKDKKHLRRSISPKSAIKIKQKFKFRQANSRKIRLLNPNDAGKSKVREK
jgi:hypothetical protein